MNTLRNTLGLLVSFTCLFASELMAKNPNAPGQQKKAPEIDSSEFVLVIAIGACAIGLYAYWKFQSDSEKPFLAGNEI